ncbi:MAG: HD domain-containing protein [Bacilli bacterium]|nr:HD domain-containing protein [Bacilli bacterium]MDD4795622.1 HD domain-containing protein [Bacilli bacterium]
MEKEFDSYVNLFDTSKKFINIKIYHSKRVAAISEKLASALNWPTHDVKLAKQIGLLHDIGRFDEFQICEKYGNNNFDHGKHGVDILKKNNFTSKFKILDEDKEILFEAIYYHNKKLLPDYINNKYAKLLRDADKIDILYLFPQDDIYNYNNNYTSVISKKVHDAFMSQQLVSTNDINTYGEFVILCLGFIYDINFDCSLRMIKENDYVNKIYNKIDNKEIYKIYFNKINEYIEKRIKNVR